MENNNATSVPAVASLIADLKGEDGMKRQRARIALVDMKEQAVPALVEVLKKDAGPAHWEAAKALGQIGSPQSVPVLIEALEDDEFSVRWLAAEALINLGNHAVAPLLQALVDHADSSRLREGAHHVLHDWIDRGALGSQATLGPLAPVYAALSGVEPALETPQAAHRALRELRERHAS